MCQLSHVEKLSEELAKRLGHDNFKASAGWLSQWKCRFGIKFKEDCADAVCMYKGYATKPALALRPLKICCADAVSPEQWKSTSCQTFFRSFVQMISTTPMKQVYFIMPLWTVSQATNTTLSGSEKAVDRITVLCCSNISGTVKWKLLFIGKSANPLCFKGINMDSLPGLYCANKNAWMTSEIFKKWLMSWMWNCSGSQGKFY
jgi:hypothetical protein